MPDEYEELQKLRALWSKAIITRDYIFIPLVMGIVAVSLSQLPNFPVEWRIPFLVFEGILLTASALYWRSLSRSTDKEIVRLYGRMIELEKQNEMDIQTKYFYANLKSEHRKDINKKIGLDDKNSNFSKFKEAAEAKQKNYHYDLLLEKWNQHEYESVGTRGHIIHEVFAGSLIGAYWFVVVIVAVYFSNQLLQEIPK